MQLQKKFRLFKLGQHLQQKYFVQQGKVFLQMVRVLALERAWLKQVRSALAISPKE